MLALPVGLAANVLKVGHHGSNTASGQLFLDAVMPQAAIVSVGAKTPYHLPGAATLQRLTAATTLYRTDTDGTVAVTLGYGRTAAGKVGGSVADGMYDRMDGIGSHDVVIETPRHDRQLEDMSVPEIADIFRTFILRVNELKKDPRIKYVMIFKNFGRNAGASLAHPHSQIVAMPMTPIRVAQEIAGAKKYREDRGVCVFCDILRQETRYKKRVVGETGNFLAVTPYASRFTFETWIIPKKHQSHFERMAPGLDGKRARATMVRRSPMSCENRGLGDLSLAAVRPARSARRGRRRRDRRCSRRPWRHIFSYLVPLAFFGAVGVQQRFHLHPLFRLFGIHGFAKTAFKLRHLAFLFFLELCDSKRFNRQDLGRGPAGVRGVERPERAGVRGRRRIYNGRGGKIDELRGCCRSSLSLGSGRRGGWLGGCGLCGSRSGRLGYRGQERAEGTCACFRGKGRRRLMRGGRKGSGLHCGCRDDRGLVRGRGGLRSGYRDEPDCQHYCQNNFHFSS